MEKVKKVQDLGVTGKRVVLRVDFNCPVKDGQVLDDYRIERSLETFEYLLEQKAGKIVALAHLGRPEGKFTAEFSLKPVVERFQQLMREQGFSDLEVPLIDYKEKIEDCILEAKKQEAPIVFLENIRFWPGDEAQDESFVEKLAEAGECFVNDAFGVCHRANASVSELAHKLPAAAGFLIQEELREIERITHDPKRPAIAVVGGAKLETKIPVLETLAQKYDQVLVGGLIAVELESEEGKAALEKLPKEKIKLPLGYADEEKRDISQETAQEFGEIIKNAKTIFWNGPMGKFEEKPFDEGSRLVGEAIVNSGAFTLAGGGETNEFLAQIGLFSKIDFVSTGGGAMLDVVVGKELPGIVALRDVR